MLRYLKFRDVVLEGALASHREMMQGGQVFVKMRLLTLVDNLGTFNGTSNLLPD